MRHQTTAGKSDIVRRCALFLGSAVALSLTCSAMAASNIEIDGDNRGIVTPGASSVGGLHVSIVDFTSSDELPMDIDDTPLTPDGAPVLNLGPRVEVIIRDIFGASALEEERTSLEGVTERQELTMAPLAESSPAPTGRDALEDETETALDSQTYSPLRVQREMYRTDI